MNLDQFIEKHRRIDIPDDVKQRMTATVRNRIGKLTPARRYPALTYGFAAALSAATLIVILLNQKPALEIKPLVSSSYFVASYHFSDLTAIMLIPEEKSPRKVK